MLFLTERTAVVLAITGAFIGVPSIIVMLIAFKLLLDEATTPTFWDWLICGLGLTSAFYVAILSIVLLGYAETLRLRRNSTPDNPPASDA